MLARAGIYKLVLGNNRCKWLLLASYGVPDDTCFLGLKAVCQDGVRPFLVGRRLAKLVEQKKV